MNSLTKLAKALGRRGGLARARSLSGEERRKIASSGGRSRALSHHALRHLEDNFRYLEAIDTLRRHARTRSKSDRPS